MTVIRLRSPEGMSRVTLPDGATLNNLYQETKKFIPNRELTISNQQNGSRPFAPSDQPLEAAGIKHGDLLFVALQPVDKIKEPRMQQVDVKLDPVDSELQGQDGLIQRSKDEKFCRHGPKGMCDYCMPLEPFDAKYLEENKIKHMSYYAWIKQLKLGSLQSNAANRYQVQQGSFLLEEPSFVVDPHCLSGHLPYPQAMCAKCQLSAIVLQQQTYRMVDHVEFDNPAIVEQFIGYWRSTGTQRLGYLYGKYLPYSKTPLGIKAVVSAIYEPPQQCGEDGVELLDDPSADLLEKAAAITGLQQVGVIYTDLQDDGTGMAKVVCKRHVDSFFLSSAEVVFIARTQLKHQSPSTFCKSGNFDSKHVTVVISGDTEGNIHLSAYQVSNLCAGMVRDDVVDATLDAGLMRARESTPTKFVPEVFYKYKNEYGVTVQEAARPTFPVEYFLITLTEGFPQEIAPLFTSPKPFIQNRKKQDMQTLKTHLSSVQCSKRDALNDFHLLMFLGTMFDVSPLYTLIVENGVNFEKELSHLDSFKNLLAVLEANSSQPQQAAAATEEWSCSYCTFVNPGNKTDCGMCNLPRN